MTDDVGRGPDRKLYRCEGQVCHVIVPTVSVYVYRLIVAVAPPTTTSFRRALHGCCMRWRRRRRRDERQSAVQLGQYRPTVQLSSRDLQHTNRREYSCRRRNKEKINGAEGGAEFENRNRNTLTAQQSESGKVTWLRSKVTQFIFLIVFNMRRAVLFLVEFSATVSILFIHTNCGNLYITRRLSVCPSDCTDTVARPAATLAYHSRYIRNTAVSIAKYSYVFGVSPPFAYTVQPVILRHT